jgi:hypothetical protein
LTHGVGTNGQDESILYGSACGCFAFFDSQLDVESLVCKELLTSFGDTDNCELERLSLAIKHVVDLIILDGQLWVRTSAELGPSTAS